jgi:hypothetical protein
LAVGLVSIRSDAKNQRDNTWTKINLEIAHVYIRPLKIEGVVAGRSGDIGENRKPMMIEIFKRVENKYVKKNGEFPRRTHARCLRTGEVGQTSRATMEWISSSQDISCLANLFEASTQRDAEPMTIESSDTWKCLSRSTGVLLRSSTPRMMLSWSRMM